MFFVKVVKKAEKSALKMPEHYRKRIKEVLKELEDNPVPAEVYDVKKMEGGEDDYRIRIGGIRIVYSIFWDSESIEVVKIEWRGGAY